jgi:hypothetical protein
MSSDDLIKEVNLTIIGTHKNADPVDPITKITDQIYLGQGRTTEYCDLLIRLGITHIVSIGRIPHHSTINGPFTRYEVPNVLDVDNELLSTHFSSIFQSIRPILKKGGRVYCHCEMGCSRSATVVIALLRANGCCNSLQQSYDLVKVKRPWIAPNQGFLEQLRKFFCEPLQVNTSS